MAPAVKRAKMVVEPDKSHHQRGAAIMPQGALPFQYARERSSTGMTAMAGLGIYLDMMQVSGLCESVHQHVGLKEKSQGWSDVQMITSLMLLNVAGGESVSDLDVLEGDERSGASRAEDGDAMGCGGASVRRWSGDGGSSVGASVPSSSSGVQVP